MGFYDIWAFFWGSGYQENQNWTISAGLKSGELTTYSSSSDPAFAGAASTNVVDAVELNFLEPV